MKIFKSILFLIGILALSFPAHAQLVPAVRGVVTNLPAIITTGARSNTTSYIKLYKGSGLALAWTFNASSGTSNVLALISPSVDGTNYATAAESWTWLLTANGATTVIAPTNFSPVQLAGYDSLKISAITNQNAGTVTNGGLYYRRTD